MIIINKFCYVFWKQTSKSYDGRCYAMQSKLNLISFEAQENLFYVIIVNNMSGLEKINKAKVPEKQFIN